MKKKIFTKLCAIILIVTLITGLVQDVARADGNTNSVSNNLTPSTSLDTVQTASTDTTIQKTPTVLYELKDKRDTSVKRFLMSDNTIQTVMYSQPVHYLENGEWKDIDNTLSLEDANDSEDFSGYTNAKDDFKVKIADNSSDNHLVKIQKGKYKIEFTLDSKSKSNGNSYKAVINKKEKDIPNNNSIVNKKAYEVNTTSDTAEYKGITYNNSDLDYSVTSTGLKENIVINSKQSSYDYSFDINADNLNLELKDNVISAYDNKTNEMIYEIPAPFMYDAANEFSTDVNYTLTKKGSGYQLTISADQGWINSDVRQFPVTIDPIITVKQVKGADTSSFISSKMATTNFYNGYAMLLAGVESSAYYNCRTLLKFDLPDLEKGDIINSAYLNMTEYDVSAYTSSTPDLSIDAYKVTSDWSANNVTWNTQPSIDPNNNEVDYFISIKKIRVSK